MLELDTDVASLARRLSRVDQQIDYHALQIVA
jgi:hypothetical protein